MFKQFIDDFNQSINGLRDFVELINPFLAEHRKNVEKQHRSALHPLELASKRFLEKDDQKKEEYSKKLKEIFDGDIQAKFDENKKITLKLSGDTSKIDEAIEKLSKSTRQQELLYQSSLVSLLSTVEWFFSQILHFFYDKYPESAGIKKKTLTLEELKSFENLKDAESYLIDDKIDSVLRGSFKDWLEVLRTELSLKLEYVKPFENELIEIYLRRNILVHNGGKINSIYFSKVSDDYKKKVKIGDKTSVPEKYLERSIALLHATFILIACELWKKLEPEEDSRCEISMNIGYEYLCKEVWDISEIASIFLCQDKKMPIASRTAAQLNFWLSKKNSGKDEEIKKELDEADFSDKAKVFQLALYALREEEKAFFGLLPQVIKIEELKPQELFEFPIFEKMRAKKEFESFIKNDPIVVDYLNKKQENTESDLIDAL